MWAVGDPHIKHLDAKEFAVCDSPGIQTYFTSDEKFRVELKAHNAIAKAGSNATIISSVSLLLLSSCSESLLVISINL